MRRILIVEDDPDLAQVVTMVLENAGAVALVAHSLGEVQAMRAEVLQTDLALLDVNLGGGAATGVDVHAWLRAQGYTGEIVFLTGHAATHPVVVAASSMPGARILAKPVSLKDLARLAVSSS
jgi:DNA-binding response OmpR family regulator